MDESVKQKIKIGIAIAAGAVIIVGGIVYWWRIKHPAAQTPATTEVTAPKKGTVEPAAGVSTGTTQTKVSETTPPTDSKEAQLKRWALDFVARFGTYSTDGQSANLQQLLPLMSGDLKVWAQTHLSSPTKLGQAFSAVWGVFLVCVG
ncbi:MAG: hypothetical protein NT003_02810 [Candidatus Magasanikbacteria bacterium]|nr:hypothetical protein [Candidatus Magasanikbacteria bacterium]